MTEMMQPIEVYVRERELVNLLRPSSSQVVHKWTKYYRFPEADDLAGESEATIETEVTKEQNPSASPIGACTFCHEVLMLLSMKQQVLGEEQFTFVVHPVRASKPSAEMRAQALRFLPAIIDPNTKMASDHMIEILDYLDVQYPTDQLMPKFSSDERMLQAENLCYEVFQKFYFFIKQCSKSKQKLHSALEALNTFLVQNDGSFTASEELSNFDTEVLPLLHQIRIATQCLTEYSIPSSFAGIWRYMNRAYNSKPFLDWCPSDQEIQLTWMQQKSNHLASSGEASDSKRNQQKQQEEDKIRLIKEEPSYTFTVPFGQ